MAFQPPLPWNSWTSSSESFPPIKPRPTLLPAPYKTPDDSNSGDSELDQPSNPTPPSLSADGGKRHKCPRPGCRKSYENSQSLGRHFRITGHGSHKGIAQAAKHKCPECPKEFQRPEGLRKHREREHVPNRHESQDMTVVMQDAAADVEAPLPVGNGPNINASPEEPGAAEQPTHSTVSSQDRCAVERDRLESSFANFFVEPPQDDVFMIHGLNNTSVERRSRLERADRVVTDMETMYESCNAKQELPAITMSPYDQYFTSYDDQFPSYDDRFPSYDDLFSSYNYGSGFYNRERRRSRPLHSTRSLRKDVSPDYYDMYRNVPRFWNPFSPHNHIFRDRKRQPCSYSEACKPPDWKTYCRLPGKKLPPPIPGLPEPQNLESLLRHKERMRRFDRFMKYFRGTHTQFQREFKEPPDLELQCMMDEDVFKVLRPHKEDFRRAFKDGMSAVRSMLAGILPNNLDAALGIAEVSSAMCKLVEEEEPSTISEDDFLRDLSRLKTALAPADQVAYDYYTSLLWGDRPVKDVASEEMPDGENLDYLRDLLSKLLLDSGFEIVDKKLAECEVTFQAHLASPASSNASGATEIESNFPSSSATPLAARQETRCEPTAQPSLASSSTNNKTAPGLPMLSTLVVVVAGAIFSFVLAFVLSFSHVNDVAKIRNCFRIADRECMWNMWKYDYLNTLLADSTVAALPNVTRMLSTLLTSLEPLGTVASFEWALMPHVASDASFRVNGVDLMSRVQNAMEQCGKQARRWLRNSSLDVNRQLLQLLSSS